MHPPSRPLPPDPADCCGGGCAACVWDLYDAALAEWQSAVDAATAQTPAADEAGN